MFFYPQPATSITINHLIALSVQKHSHTHAHTVRADGLLVCVSVKFPWQQIIQSRGMWRHCEIPAVRGRITATQFLLPLWETSRACQSKSARLVQLHVNVKQTLRLTVTRTHTHTHRLCGWKHEEKIHKHYRNQIKWTTSGEIGVKKLINTDASYIQLHHSSQTLPPRSSCWVPPWP